MDKKNYTNNINVYLCFILAGIMIFLFFSYYVNVLAEVKLTKLGADTIALNNENIELQNKLDNLLSYSNVEQLARGQLNLDVAREVIEVDEVNTLPPQKQKPKPKFRDYYRFSLGF